jgi:hypothetical protein
VLFDVETPRGDGIEGDGVVRRKGCSEEQVLFVWPPGL